MLMYGASFIVLLVATLATSQTIEDCPPNVARDEYLQVYGDACFQFVVYRKRNYGGARTDCEDQGGTLVMIKSEEIQNYIVDQLSTTYNETTEHYFWIGLDDIEEEGTFLWADGSNLTYTNWYRFGISHITQERKLQDCVVLDMTFDGQWWQKDCSHIYIYVRLTIPLEISYPYICQYNLTQ